MAIWWPDCVWDIGPPFGVFEGHAGVERAVKEVLWPVWRETHHLTSNLSVSFDDPDHARGVCDVDCMGATRDDVVQMISATYRDHVRTPRRCLEDQPPRRHDPLLQSRCPARR